MDPIRQTEEGPKAPPLPSKIALLGRNGPLLVCPDESRNSGDCLLLPPLANGPLGKIKFRLPKAYGDNLYSVAVAQPAQVPRQSLMSFSWEASLQLLEVKQKRRSMTSGSVRMAASRSACLVSRR